MFRDQSSHVINKANAKTQKKKSLPSLDKDLSSPRSTVTTPTALQPSPTESDTSTSPEQLPRTPAASLISTAEPHIHQHSVKSLCQWSPAQASPTRPFSVSKLDESDKEGPREDPRRSPLNDVLGTLSYSLSPSFQERGVNLFVSRYITVSENLSHHRYDFVLDLWQPSTSNPDNDPVLASITAVGLVGVAEITQSDDVLHAARKSYVKALRLTNAVLRGRDDAVKDTTMLSVLVLALFEMIGGSRTRDIASWQKHLNGAAALARMRGMGQFRTSAGSRLFSMLTQTTMIYCIQNEMPMPADLLEMRDQKALMLQIREPGFEVCTAMFKILQLKYDIKQGHVTSLDEMLDKFACAEGDFESAISLFPEVLQFRKCRLPQPPRPGFFNDIYHVYPDLRIAGFWNGLRTCRLLILETMLEELRKRFLHVPAGLVPKRYQSEYQKAKFKMERIALAILASVPQHFGMVNTVGDAEDLPAPISSTEYFWPEIPESDWAAELGSESGISHSGEADDEDEDYGCRGPSLHNPMQVKDADARAERFILLSSVTNNVVWPLYLVGMSTASSAQMKDFVVERLYAIHAETGVVQTRKLADIVATHRRSPGLSEQRPKSSESMDLRGWSSQYASREINDP